MFIGFTRLRIGSRGTISWRE